MASLPNGGRWWQSHPSCNELLRLISVYSHRNDDKIKALGAGLNFAPVRVTIMKIRLISVVFLAAIVGVMAVAPLRADEASRKAARIVAEAWLDLIDTQKYGESWDEAAAFFQSKIPKDKWTEMIGSGREPFGAVKSREFVGAKYVTEAPGAPDGEYVIIQYKASFENEKNAVETITPMRDADGQWRVSGYFIR